MRITPISFLVALNLDDFGIWECWILRKELLSRDLKIKERGLSYCIRHISEKCYFICNVNVCVHVFKVTGKQLIPELRTNIFITSSTFVAP